jgi:hypothetical protein
MFHRRRGVARTLLHSVARWCRAHGLHRVCVNVDPESAGAIPCYTAQRATALAPHNYWYVWDDVSAVLNHDD